MVYGGFLTLTYGIPLDLYQVQIPLILALSKAFVPFLQHLITVRIRLSDMLGYSP